MTNVSFSDRTGRVAEDKAIDDLKDISFGSDIALTNKMYSIQLQKNDEL